MTNDNDDDGNNSLTKLLNLTDALYEAITGEEPGLTEYKRMGKGTEVLCYLFEKDPNAGFVALASLLQEAGNKLPNDAFGRDTLLNLSGYFSSKAGYKLDGKADGKD